MGDFYECVGIKARNIELLLDHTQPISRNFEGRYCTSYILDYSSALSAIKTASKNGDDEVQAKLEYFRTALQNRKEIGVKESLSLQQFLHEFLNLKGLFMMLPSLGVCMPNSCSKLDIQHILMNLFNATYSNVTDGNYIPGILPWPLVATCNEEKKPYLDAAAVIVIIILSAFAILGLSAAVVDYWLDKTERVRPTHLAFKYFMAFSLYTNTRKWLSTRKGGEDFGCIHGIRFFSTAWVVIGHTFEASIFVPPWNMFDIKDIWKNWAILSVINGSFTVDTFFVMSGALATYSILKLLSKSNGKLNLVMFYLHRYLRLTPTFAIIVGINATLLIYMGNGPIWSYVEGQQQICRENWWINLLYISNIYKVTTRCVGQAWYLSNDMQFYILSPFIVYPIWKRERIGLALLSIYTILASISPILIVRYAGATPATIMTGDIDAAFKEIYYRPWARIQTFLVGVWLGWLLYKTKGKSTTLPSVVVMGLWLWSTVTACAVLYGIHPWFDPNYEIPKVPGYFYAGLSRLSWALVVSWIIFACVKGYGGIVNSFLSWKAFMPLGRLSFCVYLLSSQLQQIYHGRMTQAVRFDLYTIINIFFGHMLMSHFVAFLFTIFFESPFIALQKLIFGGEGGMPPKDVKEKVDS